MLLIVHFLPFMQVGGVETLLLELCRHRDRTRFQYVVAAPNDNLLADEIRATGTPVLTGRHALEWAARHSDLINLHWCKYNEHLVRKLDRLGRPYVTTLHWRTELPRLAAPTICTSRHVYELQSDRDRFICIPNGVDTERFAPRPRGDRTGIRLVRVCRQAKCAPFFWPGIDRVLARHSHASLTVVGDVGMEPFRRGRVSWLGLRRDIPEILADCDVFVYTPYPETGSSDLVLLEAGAAGLPCVATDAELARESVVPGVTGFLTPYEDAEAFADGVCRLIEDRPLRIRMGDAAREHIQSRFDIRQVVRRYEEVYSQVVAGRAGAVA
jgi:glycosyltransferase involved in cell wall biosynthesis